MPGDPNTGFEVGETQVFPDGTYWDQYRIGGTSLSSPLMAGVVAVADQAEPSVARLHQPAVLPPAGHERAARHRRAETRRWPRSAPTTPTSSTTPTACSVRLQTDRCPELDAARHAGLRRRDRSRYAQRSLVLPAGRSTLIACLGSRGVTRRRGTAATSRARPLPRDRPVHRQADVAWSLRAWKRPCVGDRRPCVG